MTVTEWLIFIPFEDQVFTFVSLPYFVYEHISSFWKGFRKLHAEIRIIRLFEIGRIWTQNVSSFFFTRQFIHLRFSVPYSCPIWFKLFAHLLLIITSGTFFPFLEFPTIFLKKHRFFMFFCCLLTSILVNHVSITEQGLFFDQTSLTPLATSLPALLAKSCSTYNPMIYALAHPRYRAVSFFRQRKISLWILIHIWICNYTFLWICEEILATKWNCAGC